MKEDQKIQRGIYSFLINQRLSMAGVHKILTMYAETRQMSRPKKKRLEWYATVSKLAAQDFATFKRLYNKNKKNLPYSYRQSYDEWWDECNTDGSFAYNGVTEDF